MRQVYSYHTLDNQRENLRNVTRSQNNMNRKTFSNNYLGLKCINKINDGLFRVRVSANGHRVVDQCFSNLDDAIYARNNAVMNIHGEFSWLM